MDDLSHLSTEAKQIASLSDEERFEHIHLINQEVWIPYTAANKVVKRLHQLSKVPRKHRLPSLLITSPTTNGKSRLLNHCYDLYQMEANPEGETILAPAVVVEIESPDLHEFYNRILRFLGAVFRERDRVEAKQHEAIRLFDEVGTKFLMLDELNAALAGPAHKQRAFMYSLRYLSNQTKISIIATGTKEAKAAIRLLPSLNARFERFELPLWGLDDIFLRILGNFESILPLRSASELQRPSLARKIHGLSEGYIGQLSGLLCTAAIAAIEAKQEYIDAPLLDNLDWQSLKRRLSEF